jgi:hypothetical protein
MDYRDVDHPESDFIGKKVVFVVGDSYAAGFGVKDYKDRFSNQLEKELGAGWLVINIARNGWNSVKEYKAIISYPYKPDIIILAYYLNDIQDAAVKNGVLFPPYPVRYPSCLSTYICNSYLLNYLYWRVYRWVNADLGEVYWEYFNKSFQDENIWKTHKGELLDIINYNKDHNIRLISVLLPLLIKIDSSKPLLSKVADLMKDNDIETIDLSRILSGRDPDELIVNSFDFHPSKKLHKEVAGLLFDRIQQQ